MAKPLQPHYRLFPMRIARHKRSFAQVVSFSIVAIANLACPVSAQVPGEDFRVYLVTIGPGPNVYERFGHNAIWIQDDRRNVGWAFNYGMFSFEESNFILRFVLGRMWYWVDADNPEAMLRAYQAHDRSLWVQELNLAPGQKHALAKRLEWNVRPENRRYLYDYFANNCSTMVRDVLDEILEGQIRQQLEPVATGRTYRFHTRRSVCYNPPIYTALEFILGQPVDRAISAWDEGYLPMSLRDHLRQVTVADEQGQAVPLIRSERTHYLSSEQRVREMPPNCWPWYAAMGTVIGVASAWLARGVTRNGSKLARRALAVLWGGWMLLLGFAGVFATVVWLFTSHVAAYWNENLWHFSPLAAPLIVLLPALALGRKWAGRPAAALAGAMVASGVIGLALKMLPMFFQANWDMIAMTLPAHVGVCWAVWALWRSPGAAQPGKP